MSVLNVISLQKHVLDQLGYPNVNVYVPLLTEERGILWIA